MYKVSSEVDTEKETCLWQDNEWKGLSGKFTDEWKYQWITAVHKYHKDSFYRVTEIGVTIMFIT